MDIRSVTGTPRADLDYRDSVRRRESSDDGFSQAFQQSMGDSDRQELGRQVTELLDEIETQAGEIFRRGDIDLYENYRLRLQAVMNEIVESAFRFSSERFFGLDGRQKVYSTVRVVDEELSRLGEEIISGNGTQLGFLSTIDEIRGLLTDLLS